VARGQSYFVKKVGAHEIYGGLVDSKIRSHDVYSSNDWGLPAQPFEKPAPYHRLDTGASLIATLLLSLGLWAAIWGATSLAAAVLP
jgi:hypothetical protein